MGTHAAAEATHEPAAAPAPPPGPAGHFGRYGGRFVPEALIAALDELDAAYRDARTTRRSLAELAALTRRYTGRPSPLTEVPRFAEHAGGARTCSSART